ncbi:ABC transporter ATP-binding protein [Herbaspirillum sp. RV1423]|uniref:ABC transporter ATP-binding protein n=1 Tax=Herbaspirillum sp. RV1423 TaxID=1443993 RepID=UPI0004B70D6A|nr:ABC transporter ATP-binding protein [Herbaspirillum sp. RV1423]
MLELNNISVKYGAIEAVRDASISVKTGEVVAILGANGAGKSTLLNCIAGLIHPADGSISLAGQDITTIPAHVRPALGSVLVPEGRGVFADQNVQDNLVLGAYYKKYSKAKLQEKIDSCFAMFPRLAARRHQISGTLSGGEQQMLAIARALMGEPRMLLLDEPSLGLAPIIIQDIFRSLHSLREAGLTILLVEQMANQALQLADRAYVLETGRITLSGTGPELQRDPQVRAAYLGVH